MGSALNSRLTGADACAPAAPYNRPVMTSKLRWIPALGAFFVLTVALAACGGGLPGNSVATVDNQTIKRSTFDHWMQIAAVSAAGQQNPSATTPPKVTVPDAPTFANCIATKKKTATKPAKGQPQPTDAQFKQQCQTEYEGLKTQVLSFLIRSTWLDNEAKSMKINVPDKDVQKQIDAAKKQAFPKPSDFQNFLTKQGLTEADVFYQQRSQLLEQKITQKVTKGKDTVTAAQIQAYYDKNKQRFATPERRDLRIVLTKDQAKAAQAKKALDSGQSWTTVAKKYSIDQASKGQGGKLVGVAKGQQEQALDAAVFAAPKGKITGPIKTQFGWYVFSVTKITPAQQQSVDQAKASIKQILSSSNQQKALQTFGKDYRNRWKGKTDCRKGYVTDDCKNAPKKAATTTGSTTAAPSGQGTTTTGP
ncbi:MAG: peptidylprolyl isomerase [Solirubrobacterales bacterium]|jgi:foldase protein PrsA|nr:peptidylprolyl isomerase [Solirubrobacterales bacterium]